MNQANFEDFKCGIADQMFKVHNVPGDRISSSSTSQQYEDVQYICKNSSRSWYVMSTFNSGMNDVSTKHI